MKKFIPLFLPLALAFSAASGDVTLPQIISDNMVLESAKAVIWGKADPGEKVTVKLGQSAATATADKDGRWSAKLVGLKPGTPGEMTVTGKNSLTVKNVAVGEVWLCSGQSNMSMAFKGGHSPTGGILNFQQEIAAVNNPDLRMFCVNRKSSETPLEAVEGQWLVANPTSAAFWNWSAVAYFFGRQLQQDLNLPVGVIHSSWGGTTAQAWTPTEILQGDPDFKAAYYDTRLAELAAYPASLEKYNNETLPAWQAKADAAKAAGQPAPNKPRKPILGPGEGGSPSALYNGMLNGLTSYGIKGAVWYQGESNEKDSDRYYRLLPAMINSWRKAWAQPDLPFYIVQLANFRAPTPDPVDCDWANLREAQRLTAETLPHCGLAVIIDIGEEKSVHPVNKQEVGRRLALIAEAKTYGKKIVYSGPAFDKVQFKGNAAKITFKPGTALGLKTTDGTPAKCFAIAGEDRKFVWADAKLEAAPGAQPTLVLTAPGVEKPVAVRYAWANNPPVNLVNEAGLPAVPFRTDSWPQALSKPPTPFAAPAATPVAPVETAAPAAK